LIAHRFDCKVKIDETTQEVQRVMEEYRVDREGVEEHHRGVRVLL